MPGIKVAAAVSGGVDSGTALFLLKKQGYDVAAFYTDYFGCEASFESGLCCSLSLEMKARQTAEKLGVKFYRMDFRKELSEKVIKPFVDYYSRGLTPNPCVWCNSRIRFDSFYKKVRAMGFDYLATGHYAVNEKGKLYKGRDTKKDQSYFLYEAAPAVLKNVIFPLGYLKKSVVEEIAGREGLPVSASKESQDCCLLMKDGLSAFLKEKTEVKEGNIVDPAGKVLGRHNGFQNYTIGQRRGFGGLGKKYYVIEVVPEKNIVVVGDEHYLYKDSIRIKYNAVSVKEGQRLKVKLRSTHSPAGCVIESLDRGGNICTIRFDSPQRAPTPGQHAVLYEKAEVKGGGEILP